LFSCYRSPLRAQWVGAYLHAVVQLWRQTLSGSVGRSQVGREMLLCASGTGQF